MTSPKISPGITYGNIVSWGIMIIMAFGDYVKLQDATSQNVKDVNAAQSAATEAKTMVTALKESQVASDRDIQKGLSSVALDIAVIKTQIGGIDKKLDEISIQNKQNDIRSASQFAKKE